MIVVHLEVADTALRGFQSIPKEMKPGIKKAVNELAKKSRKQVNSSIKSKYTIRTAAYQKNMLKLKRATVSNLTAEISVNGEALPLKKAYKVTKNGKRVPAKASVRKTGGVKRLQKGDLKAFVNSISGSRKDGGKFEHTGVFQRGGHERIPMRELFGPGVGKLAEKVFEPMFTPTGDALVDAINRLAAEVMK